MSLVRSYAIIFWGPGARPLIHPAFYNVLESAKVDAEMLRRARPDQYPYGYSIAQVVFEKSVSIDEGELA